MVTPKFPYRDFLFYPSITIWLQLSSGKALASRDVIQSLVGEHAACQAFSQGPQNNFNFVRKEDS